ncbi:MAG: NAD(P)H-dependent oxidoreductase [Candidatus Kapabacteria bacterium]|nr:NAD(P)H-dependent oxidoreductase [Candidatus Kapabacteria bacterium]
MNILIVHAHNEPKSFSSALKDLSLNHFLTKGHEVIVKDLFEMEFNPVPQRSDFKTVLHPDYFHYMKEQVYAFQNNGFSDELTQEMNDLEWADLLIINAPLWWSSSPAILKGWFDKVLAMGFAYHPRDKKFETGVFKNKKAFCCFTAGGSEAAYSEGGENGDIDMVLYHINHGTLYYCGFEVLPSFLTWRTHLSDEATLKGYLDQYQQFLDNLDNAQKLY